MRHKLLKIGIVLLLLGVIGVSYCSTQTKVNINNMTSSDWASCQRIGGIGAETIEKLESHSPFDRIQDVEKLGGIGPVKSAAIERHFGTYDTCRFELFVFSTALSCALIVIGALIIIYVFVRRKCTADTLTELIKR